MQLRINDGGAPAEVLVEGDTDGDGTADFIVRVKNVAELWHSDFIGLAPLPKNYIDLGPQDENQQLLDAFSDILQGTLDEHDGDTHTNFQSGDILEFEGAHFDQASLSVTYGSAILAIDADLDGRTDATITLLGDFRGMVFQVDNTEANTRIQILQGNAAPQGLPLVTGTVVVGEDLVVDVSQVTDLNGIDVQSHTYQWRRDGVDIAGATSDTYTLVQADVGAEIRVVFSYTDDYAFDETVLSDPTSPVIGHRNLIIDGDDGDNTLSGGDGDDMIDAKGGNDIVSSGLGADVVTLGSGQDVLHGELADFFGDTVTDLSSEDQMVFEAVQLLRSRIAFDAATGRLSVDEDGDESWDGSFSLQGDFSGGDFMVVRSGSDTLVTFETFLPRLSERTAVDPNLINGINNQAFLTGDGSAGFRVALNDPLAQAKYSNTLGVYEIDADGNIVDVRLLVLNTKSNPSAAVDITGVDAGNSLGFFLIQDGADLVSNLSAGDTFNFVDGSEGDGATISDVGDLLLTLNGTTLGASVFHSFDAGLNDDGVEHVLSGVDVGGESITIGFEDKIAGGDKDFQDVVFSVSTFDFV